MDKPKACRDCVEIFGSTPEEYLAEHPKGAAWSDVYQDYLCNTCRSERDICTDNGREKYFYGHKTPDIKKDA